MVLWVPDLGWAQQRAAGAQVPTRYRCQVPRWAVLAMWPRLVHSPLSLGHGSPARRGEEHKLWPTVELGGTCLDSRSHIVRTHQRPLARTRDRQRSSQKDQDGLSLSAHGMPGLFSMP